jgi:hypothetical protein
MRMADMIVPIMYLWNAGRNSRCNAWSITPLTVMNITAMPAIMKKTPIKKTRMPLALLPNSN